MPTEPPSMEQVLTLLAEAPSRIATLTADLSSAQLHAHPTPEEWSADDVLAHLRSCADVWGDCIVAILTQDLDPKNGLSRAEISTFVAGLHYAAH